MFLRRMRRRKDGKVHTYWALVESVRTVRGPRQRVVAHLGELSSGRRVGFQRLGQELEGRDGAGQLMLYGDNRHLSIKLCLGRLKARSRSGFQT